MKLSTYFKDVISKRLLEFGLSNNVYEMALSDGMGILEKMLWLRFDKSDVEKRDEQIEKALKKYNDEIVRIARVLIVSFNSDHDAMIRAFRIKYTNLYKDSNDYCHNVNGSKKVSVNISNVKEFLETYEKDGKK